MSITLDDVKGALNTMISKHGFGCGRWESENGAHFARITGASGAVVGSVTLPPHILSTSREGMEQRLTGVVRDALSGIAREPGAKKSKNNMGAIAV